jgi:glutamate--cysteine ligase regulatory subunit
MFHLYGSHVLLLYFQIDLFIISWPVGLDVAKAKELWNVMETLVDQDRAYSLGVSDIETQAFIELHSFARVKPEAIQINLESCCVVPPELVTFTRENNIQLLTHNDPQNMFMGPSETLKNIMSFLIKVHWTVRYQTLLRCRGIIQNKGYVINAEMAN